VFPLHHMIDLQVRASRDTNFKVPTFHSIPCVISMNGSAELNGFLILTKYHISRLLIPQHPDMKIKNPASHVHTQLPTDTLRTTTRTLPGSYCQTPLIIPPLIPGLTQPYPKKPILHPPIVSSLKTDNPEFSNIAKALCMVIQARQHLSNWRSTPQFILKKLERLGSLIKSSEQSERLLQDINSILSKAGHNIRNRIISHQNDRLSINRNTLVWSNFMDKTHDLPIIIELVTNHLIKSNDYKPLHSEILEIILEECINMGQLSSSLKILSHEGEPQDQSIFATEIYSTHIGFQS
jgi:hypothetical protein